MADGRGLDARRLREVDAVIASRRRDHTDPLRAALMHPIGAVLVGGIGLACALGLVAWRRSPAGAQAVWLTLAALAPAWVVMAGPWRMFWRDDARLVSRLPIAGSALFDRAAGESARHAAVLFGVLAAGSAPVFLLAGATESWPRALALLAAVCVAAGALGPAVGLAGGALATSRDAQQAISDATGAGAGPQMVWVSLLPGIGGGAIVLLGLRPSWVVLAAGVVASIALFALARASAPRSLPRALRDMSAADRVRLAHVDLDGAKGLEAAWGATAGPRGRSIYVKDVALARRRYPAYYLLGGLMTIVAWCIAAFGSEATRWSWTLGLGAAMSAYVAILAGRLVRSPVEEARLVATLPWGRPALRRAKIVYVAWRAVVPLVVATAPAVFRAADAPRLAAYLGVMAAAALLLGALRITARLRNAEDLVEL